MAQNQPGDPTAARNVSVPGAGVDRLLTGQIRDKDIKHRATDAFTELVARMYFNIVTAALGNACNTGWGGSPRARMHLSMLDTLAAAAAPYGHIMTCQLAQENCCTPLVSQPCSVLENRTHIEGACRYAELIPVAAYMLDRLKQLNTSEAVYNGLPLDEALIFDEGTERLCMQEENTLYNVRLLPLAPCLFRRKRRVCACGAACSPSYTAVQVTCLQNVLDGGQCARS